MCMVIQAPLDLPNKKKMLQLPDKTRPSTPIVSQANPTDVPCLREAFENNGLSDSALSVILSSWRKSSQNRYKPYLAKWIQYCNSRKIDHLSANAEEGVNFQAELYNNGIGYSALNTARSAGALSTALTVSGSQSFGTHPQVSRFMKGVFETRPSLTRYGETWDVNLMLDYLASLGPPEKQTLKLVTYKLVMLLSLLSGQRRQTIHALDISTMQISEEKCTFAIQSLLKTSRPGKHLSFVEFKSYLLDTNLCPVAHIAEYIKRTEPLRENQQKLFIGT